MRSGTGPLQNHLVECSRRTVTTILCFLGVEGSRLIRTQNSDVAQHVGSVVLGDVCPGPLLDQKLCYLFDG